MRTLSLAAALSLFLFTAACGKLIYLPKPPTTTPVPSGKTEKPSLGESAKQNNKNISSISGLEAKLEKLNNTMLDKRTAGYNTAEAEALLQKIKEGLRAAKDLNFEDKFSEVEAKFKELGQLFNQAKKLIDKAPKFGDQPIKKEKVERKYLDERDWVKEIRGEPSPTNIHTRGMFGANIFLGDVGPLSPLNRCECLNPLTQIYTMQNPPGVVSWYYPEDQMMYIFMEVNSIVDSFMDRNDLPASVRDELLFSLCRAQTYSRWRLIYAGKPNTDIDTIFDQVFAGRMRNADMFGVGAISSLAKATAALPDLTIASMAFDTSFQELNRLQAEQFEKFYELIGSIDPEVVKVSDSIKEIRDSSITDAEKDAAIKAFLKNQPDTIKKKLEAVVKIARWQRSLSASEGDIRGLIKLYQSQEKEIEEACSSFRETIMKLQAAFGSLRRALLKFKTQFPELLFKETDRISVFMLLEGVRFKDKTLADGNRIEVPDISVNVLVKMLKGKYEEPVFVGESREIKVDNVNHYIDEVKEYRRLASFGIAFPFNLPPGRYEITFTITDNLRVKTVAKDVSWTVVAVVKP